MKNLKTLILISIMVLSIVISGCGNNASQTKEPEEIVFGENIVAIAGDYEITKDDLLLYVDLIIPYIQNKSGRDEGWEDMVIDGKTARDTVLEYALEEAKYQQILLDVVKSEGLYDDAADAEFTQNYLEESFGTDGYEEFLNENGFSDEAFKKYISSTGAYYSICPEDKADEIYREKYMTVKHILVLFEGRDSEDAALEEAKAIYERAVGGENFEMLAAEFNEDPGQDVETGYTFTEGTMVTEFYEASLNLVEEEISEPVRTDYGYHIIKRYPLAQVGTAQYEECVFQIMDSEYSAFLYGEKITSMIEKNVLHVNDELLKTVDLSGYTVKSETATQ